MVESKGDDGRDEVELTWMAVTSRGEGMGTPLIAACADGNLRRVRKLIRKGADVNQVYYEGGADEGDAGEELPMSPLKAAKVLGGAKPELVRTLVEVGAYE